MFASSYLGDPTPAQLERERFLTNQIAALQQAIAQAKARGEEGMPHYVQMTTILAQYRREVATVRGVNQAAENASVDTVASRVGTLQTTGANILDFLRDTATKTRDTALDVTGDVGTGLKFGFPALALGAAILGYIYLGGRPKRQAATS